MACSLLVESIESPGEQDHGCVAELFVLLHGSADFVAVLSWHVDVCQNKVRLHFVELSNSGIAVADGNHVKVTTGKHLCYEALNRRAVVREENEPLHCSPSVMMRSLRRFFDETALVFLKLELPPPVNGMPRKPDPPFLLSSRRCCARLRATGFGSGISTCKAVSCFLESLTRGDSGCSRTIWL